MIWPRGSPVAFVLSEARLFYLWGMEDILTFAVVRRGDQCLLQQFNWRFIVIGDGGWYTGDEKYMVLKEMIEKQSERKERWTMCEMIRSVERRGREQGLQEGMQVGMQTGLQTGIIAMIQENLDMGKEKENILAKIVKYFSITAESAADYYNQVVEG